ncbi:MAG: FAD-dependent oxidoreductase [Bacteroidia bacterium]|nr:FAD-dependent oxidoreductase [Bacteroidia bacterium]
MPAERIINGVVFMVFRLKLFSMDLKTGMPYWLIKNGLPGHYPKLNEDLKTEVVIIGGGISGALAAYHLSKRGVSCVVLDRRTIGLGSTCASTSLVQYELDRTLYELSSLFGEHKAAQVYVEAVEAVHKLDDICEELKFKNKERCPSLYFADKKSNVTLLQKEYAMRKKAGIDVSLLEDSEIRNRFGFSAPGAIESATGLSIDVYMLCHALCNASLKQGAKVYDRTEVIKTEGKNKFKIYTDTGFTVSCNYLVNAGGYEAGKNLKGIVKLCSTYAIASEHFEDPSQLWPNRAMLWNTAKPYLYLRQTPDNRVIIGGRDELFYQAERRDDLIKRKSKLLEADFYKIFPDLNFKSEFSWAGTFGVTKDSLPYIGSLKGNPRVYYSLGYGGNGILFSLTSAEIISDAITGKKNNSAELYSFYR